jgi:dual-specificity kinase
MSASTTLPPQHPNYGYSHHQTYQSSNGYRNSSTLLSGGSRLGASYNFSTASSNSTPTSVGSVGVADPSRPSQNAINSSRQDTRLVEMPASSSTSATKSNSNPTSKKRARSREREPDWHKFYKNGLPKEVIVIDDSPTPEPSESIISNTLPGRSVNGANSRPMAKKRKRDDVGSAYDPIYHLGPSVSNNRSPEYKEHSGSTISTDRTTSAIHTTAATSLGSHSSNGQNGYEAEEVQPGQKRKRTATRLQIANEAKRKELEVNGDAFTNYKPPPRPPIKAPEVLVKQVADVSFPKSPGYSSTNTFDRIPIRRTARSTTTMVTILLSLTVI